MEPLAYAVARNMIQTGDLIGVRDVHGIVGWSTVFFTRRPYTHTGVALWLGARLFMAELNAGRNHLTAVSQLTDFDVCAPPVANRSAIESAIFDWLAKPIAYGFAAFILIGLRAWLRLKTFIHWRRVIVCSGGSVEIYEMAGWPEHSRMISPGELVDELTMKLSVRGAAIPSLNQPTITS